MENFSAKPESIELKVRLFPKDVLIYNLFLLWDKMRILFIFLFLSLFPGVLSLFTGRMSAEILPTFIPGIIVIIGIVYTVFYSKQFKDKEKGALDYSIDDEGIIVKNATSITKYGWATFVEIKKTRNYFYLFVDKAVALVIPKRSFSTEKDLEAFIALLPEIKRRDNSKSLMGIYKRVIIYTLLFLVIVGIVSIIKG